MSTPTPAADRASLEKVLYAHRTAPPQNRVAAIFAWMEENNYRREAERVPPTGEEPVAWQVIDSEGEVRWTGEREQDAIRGAESGGYMRGYKADGNRKFEDKFAIRPLYLHPPVVAQQEGQ